MKTLYREIIERLEEIGKNGPVKEPDGVLDADAHVAGVISDDTKKIYGLREEIYEEAKGLKARGIRLFTDCEKRKKDPHESPELLALAKETWVFELKKEAVDKLFWNSVRWEFPELTGKGVIGIYAGWKVAWTEDKDDEPRIVVFGPFPSFLRGH